MAAHYDQIGKTYSATRAADPRIVDKLVKLLSLHQGARLIDIGAGTGNYSSALAKRGFQVEALEPSPVMRAQGHTHENLSWVDGGAEAVPFEDNTFDGVVMTLCLHHLQDWQQGLREALRVSGGGPVTIFAFDIEHKSDFWLCDYFPGFSEVDQTLRPTIAELNAFVTDSLNADIFVEPYPLPKDLADHFAAADWARPHNYLDENFRNGVSTFHKLDRKSLQEGLQKLESDLANGRWSEQYGHLLEQEFYDNGYLFIRIER